MANKKTTSTRSKKTTTPKTRTEMRATFSLDGSTTCTASPSDDGDFYNFDIEGS